MAAVACFVACGSPQTEREPIPPRDTLPTKPPSPTAYLPEFYRGKSLDAEMGADRTWSVREAGTGAISKMQVRWGLSDTLALFLMVDQGRPGSDVQVNDALVFDRRRVSGLITIGPDIGEGCRLEEPGERSQLLIGRATYEVEAYDPNSCDVEYASHVEEAWLADTSAMRFVPVEDLSRVRCYRGACP